MGALAGTLPMLPDARAERVDIAGIGIDNR